MMKDFWLEDCSFNKIEIIISNDNCSLRIEERKFFEDIFEIVWNCLKLNNLRKWW
jgi:hypothetical protein